MMDTGVQVVIKNVLVEPPTHVVVMVTATEQLVFVHVNQDGAGMVTVLHALNRGLDQTVQLSSPFLQM